jgi:hypothetical protein
MQLVAKRVFQLHKILIREEIGFIGPDSSHSLTIQASEFRIPAPVIHYRDEVELLEPPNVVPVATPSLPPKLLDARSKVNEHCFTMLDTSRMRGRREIPVFQQRMHAHQDAAAPDLVSRFT